MAKIRFRNGSGVSDYCPFPVGTYLHCTYDPNSEWPGTSWAQQAEGRYLVSSGSTYVAGSSYGSNTTVLSVAHMPSHSHSFRVGGKEQIVYSISGSAGSFVGGLALGTGQAISITSTGGGQAFNNMPPYVAAYFWKRTE